MRIVVMRWDHIRTKDLNLLVVLAVLLEERSTTRAAARLALTQSAVSRALQRLRDMIGDPLFVRTRDGLAPTTGAEALRERLRVVLEGAGEVLAGAPAFDPAAARRTFTIGAADLSESWLVARVVAAIREQAPGIDLASISEQRAPLVEALEAGRIDVSIMPEQPVAAGIRRQALLTEGFACLLREGHPALKRRWDLERFAELGHLLVAPRGAPGGIVDRVLAEHGLTRRVVARVSSFGSAPEIVATTDLVTTLPRSLVTHAAARLPLAVREAPVAIPEFTLYQHWHERVDADPAHRWFRGLIHAAAAAEAAERRGGRGSTRPKARAPKGPPRAADNRRGLGAV
jgi:DNA-binding transcriptional LysR family regulator